MYVALIDISRERRNRNMLLLVTGLIIYFLVLNQNQRTRIKDCINGIFDSALTVVEDTTNDISRKKK